MVVGDRDRDRCDMGYRSIRQQAAPAAARGNPRPRHADHSGAYCRGERSETARWQHQCPQCRTNSVLPGRGHSPGCGQGSCGQAIVTNPPFKNASEFVIHALDLCPCVVMLLRLAFLESSKRTPILDSGYLARVHVFRNRLPMMHRDGWTGPKVSNPTAFAWFVWDRDHTGPTELHRLSWEAE